MKTWNVEAEVGVIVELEAEDKESARTLAISLIEDLDVKELAEGNAIVFAGVLRVLDVWEPEEDE